MIKVTKKQWNNISNDYKGKWEKWRIEMHKDIPADWVGKRTVLSGCISKEMGSLLTEGIHFEIVE